MIDPSAPLGYPGNQPPPRAVAPPPGQPNAPSPAGAPSPHAPQDVPPGAPQDVPPGAPQRAPAGPAPPPGFGIQPGHGRPPGNVYPPGYGPPPGPGAPPPQVAQPTRPTAKRRWTLRTDPGGLVAGLVIGGIGLFFLAGQLEPDIGRFVTLFIGLALLAVFVIRREYGFLVPGSILTGVGIGIAVDTAASGEAESGVMMLALAGGFLGIWVLGSLYRLPQNHWWPLIPGGILTLIGLVQLSRADVVGALSLWPILLIVIGALVLGRALTRRT